MASSRTRKMFVVSGSYRTTVGGQPASKMMDFDFVAPSRSAVQDYLYSIAAGNWQTSFGKIPTSRKTAVLRFFAEGGNEKSVEEMTLISDEIAQNRANTIEARIIAAASRAQKRKRVTATTAN